MSRSPEEEARRSRLLAEYAATRSETVRDQIVESYTPLAEFFARRYADRSVEADDLRQVALIGLVKSIDRFDPAHEVQFATFAGRKIDGEIKHWFRDKSWAIRVPRSIKENVLAVTRAQTRLEQRSERAPTPKEIATETGLELDLVLEALDARSNYQPVRLDRPAGDESGESLGDGLISDEAATASIDMTMLIEGLLDELPEREREIVTLRYFDDLSQQEIAERVGVSQMQVSRLLRKTLGTLQFSLRTNEESEEMS